MNKETFKLAWEFFRDNYIMGMGGMEYVDERALEDLEYAFYTGAMVFMDQQANILAAHQDTKDERRLHKGQLMLEALVEEIVMTCAEKAIAEEEQLIAEGILDQRLTQPKGMVN